MGPNSICSPGRVVVDDGAVVLVVLVVVGADVVVAIEELVDGCGELEVVVSSDAGAHAERTSAPANRRCFGLCMMLQRSPAIDSFSARLRQGRKRAFLPSARPTRGRLPGKGLARRRVFYQGRRRNAGSALRCQAALAGSTSSRTQILR